MALLEEQGVVLRRVPFRETSLVVQLFTGGRGGLGVVARGVRTSPRGPRAVLSGYHTVRLVARGREGAALWTLSDAEIITGRHRLPGDPPASAAARVLLEALYRLAPAGEPQPRVWGLLEEALDAWEGGAAPLGVAAFAMARLLALLGWGWRLDGCAGCGAEGAHPYFSLKRGQPVCPRCGDPYARHLWPLTPALMDCLGRLETMPLVGVSSPAGAGALYCLAMAALTRHGGRALRADAPFRALAGLEPLPWEGTMRMEREQ